MEFGYFMFLSGPKYPNPIRIRKLHVFYKYFNYRSEPIWIRKKKRSGSKPKIYKYLLDLNI